MNWKIARDPYYSELYLQYGEEFIKEAGFFYDTATENYDIKSSLDIMCTPINFVKKNLVDAKRPCILITTGSFAPIHTGHIEAMVKTKEKMEDFGWTVVGGFIAPDHDEYINLKLKKEALPFHHRMKLILEMVRGIDWLTVDPWAGVFQTCAVNFTDIIEHLDLYIQKHLGVKIPIVYVCGNDNARFANTFVNRGYCAIAERPGYKNLFEFTPQTENRIFHVSKPDASSSTQIRKGLKFKLEKKKVKVRLHKEMSEMDTKLLELINERFDDVELLYIEDQRKNLRQPGDRIITLDPMTKGTELAISREYDYFGTKRLGFVNRPGSLPIDEQIDFIKRDFKDISDVILHDDDICTGGTIEFAKQALKRRGINVMAQMSYTHSTPDVEIIDLRDLIVGDYYGGLVITEPNGETKRFPYVYPFVCPFVRASINDPMEFSIKVWEINATKEKYTEYCQEQVNLLKSFINK